MIHPLVISVKTPGYSSCSYSFQATLDPKNLDETARIPPATNSETSQKTSPRRIQWRRY
jgi:hypothetical protein